MDDYIDFLPESAGKALITLQRGSDKLHKRQASRFLRVRGVGGGGCGGWGSSERSFPTTETPCSAALELMRSNGGDWECWASFLSHCQRMIKEPSYCCPCFVLGSFTYISHSHPLCIILYPFHHLHPLYSLSFCSVFSGSDNKNNNNDKLSFDWLKGVRNGTKSTQMQSTNSKYLYSNRANKWSKQECNTRKQFKKKPKKIWIVRGTNWIKKWSKNGPIKQSKRRPGQYQE